MPSLVPLARAIVGAASLDAGGGEGVHADLADVLRLQLHGYVLDDVLEEGLVRGHLGLLHHGHVGPHPGAEYELGPLGKLVARLYFNVAETTLVGSKVLLEVVKLLSLGFYHHLVVLIEGHEGPLDPGVAVGHDLVVGLQDGGLVHGGGHVVLGGLSHRLCWGTGGGTGG